MEYIFIWNTIIGYFISLIVDVLQRDKASQSSPVKFNMWFFLKDNRDRLILSFLLSTLITIAIVLNTNDAANLLGKDEIALNNLIYIAVGAVPDLIIGLVKNKTKWLRPDEVDGYTRK